MPGKVLIVDQNKAFTTPLQKALAQYDLLTEVRADAVGGSAMVQKFQPDLLILQLNLPGGGARVVYRALRRNEKFGNTPVILLASPDELEPVWGKLESRPHPQTLVIRKSLNLKMLIPVVKKKLGAKPPDWTQG